MLLQFFFKTTGTEVPVECVATAAFYFLAAFFFAAFLAFFFAAIIVSFWLT